MHFLLPFQTGRRWINLQQIVRPEGIGNYTICMFADGSQLMVALTIKRLLNRIPSGQFVRLHRKHLVNRAFITGVRPTAYVVDLSNGDKIAIARRRVGALMEEVRVSAWASGGVDNNPVYES
jgi:two-component system, LytTR family, response regulator